MLCANGMLHETPPVGRQPASGQENRRQACWCRQTIGMTRRRSSPAAESPGQKGARRVAPDHASFDHVQGPLPSQAVGPLINEPGTCGDEFRRRLRPQYNDRVRPQVIPYQSMMSDASNARDVGFELPVSLSYVTRSERPPDSSTGDTDPRRHPRPFGSIVSSTATVQRRTWRLDKVIA